MRTLTEHELEIVTGGDDAAAADLGDEAGVYSALGTVLLIAAAPEAAIAFGFGAALAFALAPIARSL